ncbi:MAG: DUF4416 family protein [Chitinispirillaceae bacterium]|nr:DUF4416 family protein [Chitinispirillaceae bacterium]
MGTAQIPASTVLFFAIMYHKRFTFDRVMECLERRFGHCDSAYGPVPFIWTGYYAREMGEELLKTYLCHHAPFPREELPSVKVWTNALEQELAQDGRRIVNIDPGYLARDKLVLASTKDFYHRLYLGRGIYGEVTLHFRQGRYRHFSWTYPDFKEEKLQEFLMMARAKLVGELRKENGK